MNIVFHFDHDEPLARVSGNGGNGKANTNGVEDGPLYETRAANEALGDYYRMGAQRTIRKLHAHYKGQVASAEQAGDVYEPPTLHLSTLFGWSAKYRWQDRVIRREEIERDRQERRWIERQDALRDQEWDAAQKLIKRAEDMLRFPLASVTTENRDGDKVVIQTINPARWTASDIRAFMAEASRLGRLASGLETERGALGLKSGRVFIPISEIEIVTGNDKPEPPEVEDLES